MSTIHHHHDRHHLPGLHPGWFFAAAAVLVGVLLALVIANALSATSGPGAPVGTGNTGSNTGNYQPVHRQCFAGRPSQSIELSRAGCFVGAP